MSGDRGKEAGNKGMADSRITGSYMERGGKEKSLSAKASVKEGVTTIEEEEEGEDNDWDITAYLVVTAGDTSNSIIKS